MAICFLTTINWGPNLLGPLHQYPKILPKEPLERVPWPLFRTLGQLKELAPAEGYFTNTYGYAELKFQPALDPEACFRKFPDGTRQFTGGTISLTLGITIYIHHWLDILGNPHKLKPDDLKLGFSIAMSHELDHVVDASKVLHDQLPDLLDSQSDTTALPEDMQRTVKHLRQLLLDGGQGQPARLSETDYQGWFTPKKIYETEDGRIVNRFEDSVLNLFADRYNVLLAVTDSDARHTKVENALGMIVQGNAKYVTWP